MKNILSSVVLAFGALLLSSAIATAREGDQKERFEESDTNRDGVVDVAEHGARVRADFKAQDVNADGYITIAEYQIWLEKNVAGAHGKQIPLPSSATKSVAVCFFGIVGGPGATRLSAEQIKSYEDRIFHSLDENKDDRLTFEESKRVPPPDVVPRVMCR